MKTRLLTGSAIAMALALPAHADSFNRVASFVTTENMAAGEDTGRSTSAEIISVSEDGMKLVYSDSPLGVLGFVDITDPKAPKALGNVEMEGEPTTAVIVGDRAFVGVNTSESKTAPSGALRVIDMESEEILASCDLDGQPDSVAKARDGSFLAIAIENERDEDLNDGALPQMPAGYVVKLPISNGSVDCATLQKIDLTGLATISPDDPEPEYVDINEAGEIVVSLQENNHIVIIGADGRVASHFTAGAVDFEGIDTKSDGRLSFSGKKEGVLREPDGVKWIGNDLIATANEGDWNGGSRGWTIFDRAGTVVHEAGASFEHAIAEIGHYPEGRSKSKGVEPESVEYARFGDTPYLFVASERASIIGVYDVTHPAKPVLKQLLPSGVSPEGMVAIPSRNLFVTANEADLGEDGGARAHVMIYEYQAAEPAYPTITSAGAEELIGWGALSGLVADPQNPGRLYAVSDSVYGAEPRIFTIDVTQKPARIIAATTVTRAGQAAQKLDLEGIALDGKGGFWLASEGRSDRLIPHAIYRANAKGEITKEIPFPAQLLADETRFGLEGITVDGDILWMAVQREWGDDAKGQVKILGYDTKADRWGYARYGLEPKGEGWIGLSEIVAHGDHAYFIERDNLVGAAAKVKLITRVRLEDLRAAAFAAPEAKPANGSLIDAAMSMGDAIRARVETAVLAPEVVTKEIVRDLIPDLMVLNGYAPEKVEGLAVDAEGNGWLVTDNDGVDGSSGETLFWTIGKVQGAN